MIFADLASVSTLASHAGSSGSFMPSYKWDFSVVWAALPELADGLRITVELTVVIMLVSLPLGLLIAFARLAPFRALNAVAYVYTELFRTIPLLVLVIWFYFVPGVSFGIQSPVEATAVAAFSLNMSAFLAEVFRGSILSVDRGQREAALTTGMTEVQTMRRIVLPQAVRRAIPLIAALWISLFKDTSLVATIGVHELTYQARALAVITYRPIETLTAAAVIYFIVTYPQSLIVNHLFERLRVVE